MHWCVGLGHYCDWCSCSLHAALCCASHSTTIHVAEYIQRHDIGIQDTSQVDALSETDGIRKYRGLLRKARVAKAKKLVTARIANKQNILGSAPKGQRPTLGSWLLAVRQEAMEASNNMDVLDMKRLVQLLSIPPLKSPLPSPTKVHKSVTANTLLPSQTQSGCTVVA